MQKHVLDHLRQYVREDVLVDGETVLAKEWRCFEPLVSVGMDSRVHVGPRTRLLRVARLAARKRKRAEPEDRVVLSDERELRRVDGNASGSSASVSAALSARRLHFVSRSLRRPAWSMIQDTSANTMNGDGMGRRHRRTREVAARLTSCCLDGSRRNSEE